MQGETEQTNKRHEQWSIGG